jgi:UDP-2,3-diacylglucosamine pyrophosphatase LpxH
MCIGDQEILAKAAFAAYAILKYHKGLQEYFLTHGDRILPPWALGDNASIYKNAAHYFKKAIREKYKKNLFLNIEDTRGTNERLRQVFGSKIRYLHNISASSKIIIRSS